MNLRGSSSVYCRHFYSSLNNGKINQHKRLPGLLLWKLYFSYFWYILQRQDDMLPVSAQLLSQNAFGYVLPITSFVVAWLETWFLDFKVLTQEAEDERGEGNIWDEFEQDSPKKTCFSPFNHFSPSAPAYLAAVNAACERAPMIYPRAVSDGQFYSPPESVAGEVLSSPQICS